MDGQLHEDSGAATRNRPLLQQALAAGLDDARARVDDELAAAVKAGACLVTVLEFWPTSPPAKYTFPRRNVVTSGTTLGQRRHRGLQYGARQDAGPAGRRARS
ncbi:hypothetical protein [Streptomyces sp. NPDC007883]|uniref:hypothetical protein n=1 Tax=Streptomyces sp. NPDC007883 TaxID=3155116 RepID=UPI0033DD7373